MTPVPPPLLEHHDYFLDIHVPDNEKLDESFRAIGDRDSFLLDTALDRTADGNSLNLEHPKVNFFRKDNE